MDGRKDKRELFAREYLKDLNAAAAARRAGYSEGYAREASRTLLVDPWVEARISELAAERNKQLGIDARQVLEEIREIALADPAAAYDEYGVFYRDIHQIPAGLRKTISSVKTKELFGPEGEQTGEVIEVKFWDKTRALDMLMRHLALYKDSLKLEGLDDLAERIVRARKQAGA